ncbi:MAG: hypothetical protein H0X30_00125 [Anaerolineae bacterium]|nr:hypothetical protein [Anaerolineae bacterium]
MNKDKPPHSEAHKVARELATLLGEKHHGVIGQIRRMVQLRGIDFSRELYAATLAIEANGGLMLPDYSRRRTPGGVFLYLVRSRLDADQRQQVFSGRAKAGVPLLSWTKRIAIIQSLQSGQGKIVSLTLSLRGRPERIEKRAEVVILTLSDEPSIDNLPREIPKPPATPTRVVVYVALEQWRAVEAALTNSSDRLLVEGSCAFDPAIKSVVVFATSVQIEVLKTHSQKTGDKPQKTKAKA